MFKKAFNYLFPAVQKTCYTYQGRWLRYMLAMAVALHWVFFVFCLYFVGFWSTMFNLGLAFKAYSVYLTMRQKQLFCYFFLLVMAAGTELFQELGTKVDSTQKIGLIINVVIYFLNIFFVGKAWWAFK